MAARILTSQICNGGAFPSKIPHPPVAHFPHLPATHFPHLPAASRPNFLKLAASRPNFPKLAVSRPNFQQLPVQLAVSRGNFTPRSKVNTDSDLMTNLETAPDPANLGGSPPVVPERIFKFLTVVLPKVWKSLTADLGDVLQSGWRWSKARISKTSFITPLLSDAAPICCFSTSETAWSSRVKATIPADQEDLIDSFEL